MTELEMIDALNTVLAPMKKQMESMEIKLDTLDLKVDTLQLNQKTTARAIRKDIQYLNDEVDTLIAVLEAKDILPKVEGR